MSVTEPCETGFFANPIDEGIVFALNIAGAVAVLCLLIVVLPLAWKSIRRKRLSATDG